MSTRIQLGFVAGFLGALVLVVLMGVMQIVGYLPQPGFVGTYHAVIGVFDPTVDWIVSAFLFAVSGGIWGAIFGVIVDHPTPGRGMLFGLIPSLWLWLVVAPISGGRLFNGFATRGIVLPLLFNVVIWGAFVGWYMRRRLSRPS